MNEIPYSSVAPVIRILVNRRYYFLTLVAAITVVMVLSGLGMQSDKSFESGINTKSPYYKVYRDFMNSFGNEEFILVAVKNEVPVSDPAVLDSLRKMVKELERSPHIERVIALSNLSIFREKQGLFGSYPLMSRRDGRPALPPKAELERLRRYIPVLEILLSKDNKTVGVILKIPDSYRFHPELIEQSLDAINTVAKSTLLPAAEFRVIGPAVLRHAVHDYNLQTARLFGLMSLLISTLVATYIFKSVRISFIAFTVVSISMLWMIGLMTIFGIRLSSTTALSFGLILIVSAAAIVHISTHYNDRYRESGNRIQAAQEALMVVGRPCLMCSLTTATGFASIMISDVPMVRQLGLVMSTGVLVAYVLAIVVTPALLIMLTQPSERAYKRMSADWVAVTYARLEKFVFNHHKLCTGVGIAIAILLVAGAPRIASDTQVLRMLSDRTKEVADLRFVESNLGSIHGCEVVIEADEGAFKTAEAWKRISKTVQRLREIPEVVGTDSLLPVLHYLRVLVSDKNDEQELFTSPELIPQLLVMTSFSKGGKEIVARYVDEEYSKVRISVRIKNSPGIPIGDTLEKIRSTAEKSMNGHGNVVVTGELALFAEQAMDLVRAQTLSLFIALSVISCLMILQLRSISLGLLSLIPNVLPLAVIFGFMGWFGIPLDSVTVFAATVSIGLSVDDTIHYLTQLRREIGRAERGTGIEECLARAYRVTAKALISTSAILFFGFLVLTPSPFNPVVYFGILGSSAVIAALVGDLVFMPAIILTFPFIKRIINREMRLASVTK